MSDKPTISKPMLYGIMIGMLATGTLNTMIMKIQDSTQSPPDSGCVFTHPYQQGMFMFFGEFACFLLLFAKRAIYGHENKPKTDEDAVPLSPGMAAAVEQKKLNKINPIWLAIPASCDFMGSSLMFLALTMVPASVYQMMRGFIVVITALFSVVFLGRKLHRHHWTSIVVIVLGVAQVGWVSTWPRYRQENISGGSEVMGIILLLCSQLFTGTQFIVEEKLLGDYYLDPMVIVGNEGMWGLVYYIGVLIPMQIKTCGVGYVSNPGPLAPMCNYGYLENSAYGFY